ncbi:hypothetical protein B0J18DRAFT_434962 [Chaetomium sp. MPI-SDFR-AT-0129]|nr:hypothetical protein B0J18DRAFT_434962 [Chaetomium sp. MPI-SDFR-AT-0129]
MAWWVPVIVMSRPLVLSMSVNSSDCISLAARSSSESSSVSISVVVVVVAAACCAEEEDTGRDRDPCWGGSSSRE